MTAIFPLGFIEPHRELLSQPSDDTMLWKVMSLENFGKSLAGNYLHFNRIDQYAGDGFDGDQPRRTVPATLLTISRAPLQLALRTIPTRRDPGPMPVASP